jgi:hypothetical protein
MLGGSRSRGQSAVTMPCSGTKDLVQSSLVGKLNWIETSRHGAESPPRTLLVIPHRHHNITSLLRVCRIPTVGIYSLFRPIRLLQTLCSSNRAKHHRLNSLHLVHEVSHRLLGRARSHRCHNKPLLSTILSVYFETLSLFAPARTDDGHSTRLLPTAQQENHPTGVWSSL